MQNAPQSPFFTPIKRLHLTEEELNAPVRAYSVKVWGDYTTRGEHRKEVILKQYEADIEVPENFNPGHIKLGAQRYVRTVLHGIRVRHFYYDKNKKPKALEHKRRRRDFMSEQGMRDNESLKRDYEMLIAKRKQEADQMQAGIPPQFVDDTTYGADGLPKFSEKTYVAQ